MDSPRNQVALDGSFLAQPATGVGQYTLNLWRKFSRSSVQPNVVLLRPGLNFDGDQEREIRIPPPRFARSNKALKIWWEQVGVLQALRTSGCALLHVPYLSAPRATRRRTVVTIHDVIPMIYPEYGGSTPMRMYLRLVVPAARRAVSILTDSECSRRDIVRLLHIDQRKVRSIPLAASDEFQPTVGGSAGEELRQRFELHGPIIFNVGGLDVRKNLSTLVEAFGRAMPSLDQKTLLVIAGKGHTGNTGLYPPLEPVIKKLGLEGSVRLIGRISEDEKRILYQISDVYAYPSLYEGFGLTPLEAMACGLPVIASNRSSLPEVVGSGGLLVDPTPARLAAAMVSVLTDEQLRRDLHQRALDQAAHFSWERTADETREAYRDALGHT
ncbi:MAG: glycosyltransferase family 1 protein [Nitrolancea sp.]